MKATCIKHVGDEGERGAYLLCVSTDTLLSVSITRGTRAAVVSVVHSRRGCRCCSCLQILADRFWFCCASVACRAGNPSLANSARTGTRGYAALLDRT